MTYNRTAVTVILFFLFLLVGNRSALAQPKPDSARLEASAREDAMYFDALKERVKNDDDGAEKLLQQFVKGQPNIDGAWFDLSRIAMRQAKISKATEYIRKAIALDPDNKWYQEHRANLFVMDNDFEKAAEAYADLASKEKINDDYLLKSAQLYQRAGKSKEALNQLAALQKKRTDDDEIFLLRQQIYLKMNDVDGATRIIKERIASNPNESKYAVMLAELYKNNKMPEQEKLAYKNLENKYAEDADAQYSLAEYYKNLGDTLKYRNYVRKVITNPVLDVETQAGMLAGYLRGLDWSDSVNGNEAEILAGRIAEQHPENILALSLYGDVLRFVGKDSLANQQYRQVISIDPSKYNSWEQLFDRYATPATADSLIAITERARKLFPNQAMIGYYNGVGHYFKAQYPEAVKSLNRAIELQPEEDSRKLSQMYTALGDVYNSLKKFTQSDESFDKALKFFPDNPTLLNNYAYYLSIRKERLDEAEKMSKKSLALAPDQGTFLDTYGWILYQQGNYQKALKYIQQAIDQSQDDGTLWEHLGDVKYKLGLNEEAIDAWKKAKQFNTEGPLIDKKIAEKKLYE